MNIWMETIGEFPEREGKYLICPIHSNTRRNYPMYRILEEPLVEDAVFHYVLQKASGKPNAFTSYSRVREGYRIVSTQDPLCSYLPPYRKIDLYGNKMLKKPLTMEMLAPYREELESIQRGAGFTRVPFNKNFAVKQMYLSRIPFGFIRIFKKLSETVFDFPLI